jgi:phage head maturation protease
MNLQYKEYVCTGLPTVDMKNRTANFLINTSNTDRDGDILYSPGVILDNYIGTPGHENPIIFWNHDNDRPLAYSKTMTTSIFGINAVGKFSIIDESQEKLQLIHDGVLRTCSVGFKPVKAIGRNSRDWNQWVKRLADEGFPINKKTKRIVTEWELYEFSLVGIPSNPNALVRRIEKGYELSTDTQKELGVWRGEEFFEDTATKSPIDKIPEPEVAEENIEEEPEAVKVEEVELPEEPKLPKPIVIEIPQKKIINVVVYKEASTQPKSIEVLIVEEIQRRKGRV